MTLPFRLIVCVLLGLLLGEEVGLPLGAPSSGPQAKCNLRPPDPDSPGAPALRCIESASAVSVLVSACLKADAESFMHTSASDLGTVLEMLRSLCPPSEPKVSPHRASQVLHRHSFPSLVLLFSVGATRPGSYSGKQMRMLLFHHLPGMQEVVLGTSEKRAVLLTETVRTPQKQLGGFQGLQRSQALKAALMAVAEENRTPCREPPSWRRWQS